MPPATQLGVRAPGSGHRGQGTVVVVDAVVVEVVVVVVGRRGGSGTTAATRAAVSAARPAYPASLAWTPSRPRQCGVDQ